MTINKKDSTLASPEDSGKNCLNVQDENETWIRDLIDVRVVVFLVCVIVVAMTATVLILSRDNDQLASDDIEPDSIRDQPALVERQKPGSGIPSEQSESSTEDARKRLPSVKQDSDGSFVIPVSSALVEGCQAKPGGISDWSSGGSAQWELGISDRRRGFFYCYVTYQAKLESQFAIQLGERTPVKFTMYPHDSDFTEQMIVRLDGPKKPAFTMIANQVETDSNVSIKRIRLVPR